MHSPPKVDQKMEKERSQKQDRRAVPFLGPESSNEKTCYGQWPAVPKMGPPDGPHFWDRILLQNVRKEKYYEQEDDYAEDSEQNEPGEFEGSPFMRLALHDIQRYHAPGFSRPRCEHPNESESWPTTFRCVSGSRLKHCLERGLCRLRHSRRQQLRPFFHQLIPGWSHPFHTILLPDPIVQTPFKNKASRKDELPLCDFLPRQ